MSNPLLSPAITYAVPDKSAAPPPDNDAIEKALREAGAPVDDIKSEMNKEQDVKRQTEIKDMVAREQDINKSVQKELFKDKASANIDTAVNVGAGIGAGAVDIVQNIYNGVVGLADAAENYAAQKGVGTGDLVSEANKWTPIGDVGIGKEGEIARSVTNYAGPLLATLATGGGTLLGTGVNAAYNFLAIDPKQARIADHLADTPFAEYPIAAELVDYLKTKPDDTELQARSKNMLEGLGMDAALAGIFVAATGVYKGISRMRNPKELSDITKKVMAAEDMVKNPAPVLAAEEQALKASDEAISAPPLDQQIREKINPPRMDDTPEQVATFEKNVAKIGQDKPAVHIDTEGGIKLNAADDELTDFMGRALQDDRAAATAAIPVTDVELRAQAKKLIEDPAKVEKLLAWTPEQGPRSDEELVAIGVLKDEYNKSFREAYTNVVNNPGDDAYRVHLSRVLENSQRLESMKTGMASESGRSLRAVKLMSLQTGMSEQEVLRALGDEGRAKLVKDLMSKNGGPQVIDKMAKELKLISEIPDAHFAENAAGEVYKMGYYRRLENKVTAVALNGMLSSPGTAIKAFTSNAITTGKTIVDNFLQVPLGDMTLIEANAHVSGAFNGLFEAIQPAHEAFRTGKVAGNAATMRLDLTEGMQKVFTQEETIERASGAWAQATGIISKDTLVNTPTRVLIGVDSYWQRVNYAGYVNASGAKEGMARGLSGPELTNFMKSYATNTPREVVDAANKLAATNTFAKGLEGRLAALNNGINEGMSYIPAGKVILPFIKTNINMAEYAVVNSPLGVLAPSVRNALKAGGRERDEALAKMLSGGVTMAGFGYLASQGMITGPWSANKEFSKELAGGDVPAESSIKVGDTWVSMKGIQPFEQIINTSFILSKASGYLDEQAHGDLVSTFLAVLSENMAPEALTGGLSQILDIMNAGDDPRGLTKQDKALSDIATRFVPFGALARDVSQTVDPIMRDTRPDPHANLSQFNELLLNKLSNIVPFFSESMPAARNIWGEKMMLPDGMGPDAFAPFAATSGEGMALKKSLEWMDNYYELNKDTAVGMTKFNITMPSRSIRNPMAVAQYALTPEEYSAFVQFNAGIDPKSGKAILGKTLKEAITGVFNKYDALGKKPSEYTPEKYAQMTGEMAKTFNIYRRIAQESIKGYGDIPAKLRKQAEQANKFERIEQGEDDGGQ